MSAPPTLTNALDAKRFDFIAELAETAADFAATASVAAANCDRLRLVAYLTLLSCSVANVLRVAAELRSAEAKT